MAITEPGLEEDVNTVTPKKNGKIEMESAHKPIIPKI